MPQEAVVYDEPGVVFDGEQAVETSVGEGRSYPAVRGEALCADCCGSLAGTDGHLKAALEGSSSGPSQVHEGDSLKERRIERVDGRWV